MEESAGRFVGLWSSCGSMKSCETAGGMLGSNWKEAVRFIVDLCYFLRVDRVLEQLWHASQLREQCVPKLVVSLFVTG